MRHIRCEIPRELLARTEPKPMQQGDMKCTSIYIKSEVRQIRSHLLSCLTISGTTAKAKSFLEAVGKADSFQLSRIPRSFAPFAKPGNCPLVHPLEADPTALVIRCNEALRVFGALSSLLLCAMWPKYISNCPQTKSTSEKWQDMLLPK